MLLDLVSLQQLHECVKRVCGVTHSKNQFVLLDHRSRTSVTFDDGGDELVASIVVWLAEAHREEALSEFVVAIRLRQECALINRVCHP